MVSRPGGCGGERGRAAEWTPGGDGTGHLSVTPCIRFPCRGRAQVDVPGGGLLRAQTGTGAARAPPWSTVGAAAEASPLQRPRTHAPCLGRAPGLTAVDTPGPPAWQGTQREEKWEPAACREMLRTPGLAWVASLPPQELPQVGRGSLQSPRQGAGRGVRERVLSDLPSQPGPSPSFAWRLACSQPCPGRRRHRAVPGHCARLGSRRGFLPCMNIHGPRCKVLGARFGGQFAGSTPFCGKASCSAPPVAL